MRARTAATIFLVLLWLQLALATLVIVGGAIGLGIAISLTGLLVALLAVPTVYGALSGAPFVPTDMANVARMLALAGVREGDTVVDLGAGDGRIVVAAALLGARAEGWEVNPYLWLLGQWKISRAGVRERAQLHLGSYWPEDMSRANVVTLFLITGHMKRMQEKLQHELRPGSRVVSYVFTFPDWPAEETLEGGVRLYRR